MTKVYEEMSYNFCKACNMFQCTCHSEPNENIDFTLNRNLSKDILVVPEEVQIGSHLINWYNNLMNHV